MEQTNNQKEVAKIQGRYLLWGALIAGVFALISAYLSRPLPEPVETPSKQSTPDIVISNTQSQTGEQFAIEATTINNASNEESNMQIDKPQNNKPATKNQPKASNTRSEERPVRTLFGYVQDSDNKPLSGVHVTIKEETNVSFSEDWTDAEGKFSLEIYAPEKRTSFYLDFFKTGYNLKINQVFELDKKLRIVFLEKNE